MLRDRERDRRSSPQTVKDPVDTRERPLVCTACGHRITDEDYRLNPLNLYSELPRERMFYASFKFYF